MNAITRTHNSLLMISREHTRLPRLHILSPAFQHKLTVAIDVTAHTAWNVDKSLGQTSECSTLERWNRCNKISGKNYKSKERLDVEKKEEILKKWSHLLGWWEGRFEAWRHRAAIGRTAKHSPPPAASLAAYLFKLSRAKKLQDVFIIAKWPSPTTH